MLVLKKHINGVNINPPKLLKNYFLIYSMSNNSVEFIVNKIKKSDDEFWSDYSKKGSDYRYLKEKVIEDVHEYIK